MIKFSKNYPEPGLCSHNQSYWTTVVTIIPIGLASSRNWNQYSNFHSNTDTVENQYLPQQTLPDEILVQYLSVLVCLRVSIQAQDQPESTVLRALRLCT